jgi:hypothetical protein
MGMVLVVPRYTPIPPPTHRELVQGKPVMSKVKSKARRLLEVTIVFEPSRLATTYLAKAYAQVVPLHSCGGPLTPREHIQPLLNEDTPSGREPS